MLAGTFFSAISQVLLKQSANITYKNPLREYLNWRVILAYGIFFGVLLLNTYYFTASGRACRSWLRHDGKKYYFDPETAIMYKNCTIKINGKSYTFDANGVYITAAAANKRK